jgi:pimeloyl-ACP methyl ester carboxylesterase
MQITGAANLAAYTLTKRPALVLIHGLNGTPAELLPFHHSLGQEMRVFSPALLGHAGRPLHPWGLEAIADDLIAQLDRQNVWPAFLFGYSFGVYLAFYLANRHPERIAGVISLGGQIPYDETAKRFARYVYSEERISRLAPEKRAQIEQSYGGAALMELTLARTRALLNELDTLPPVDEALLRSLRKPVLLVTGDADQFAPLRLFHAVTQSIPHARTLVFPGSAHPLASAPINVIIASMRRFLREVTVSRPFSIQSRRMKSFRAQVRQVTWST